MRRHAPRLVAQPHCHHLQSNTSQCAYFNMSHLQPASYKMHFQCSSYSCHCTFLAPKLYIERAVCCRETQLLDIIESGGWPLFTFSGDGSISGIHPLRSDNVTCPDNVASTDPGHLFQHNPPTLGFRQSGNLIDRQRGGRWQINI